VNVEVELVGQPNPPPALTGTLTAVYVTFDAGFAVGVADVPLVNGPVTLAGPFGAAVTVHVLPRTVAEAETPRCGIVSVLVGFPPLFATQSLQSPLASTVAFEPRLVLHPENLGVVIGPQTPEAGTVPLVDELVQVTVTRPTTNFTLVDVAVKASPGGETESANAG
jgi:hypothetical protein